MAENILLDAGLPLVCDGLTLYGDFRNMIRFETALHDENLTNEQKVYIGLTQLFDSVPKSEEEITHRTNILMWFYSMGAISGKNFERVEPSTWQCEDGNYINFVQNDTLRQKNYTENSTGRSDLQSGNFDKSQASSNISANTQGSARAYDFTADCLCIYASFLQAYNIDLTQADFLHWWKFCALLENLPSQTPMAQRIMYRTLDTSEIKDKAEREHYEKLKRMYAIKNAGENGVKKTLDEIAKMNKNRVKQRFEYAKNAVGMPWERGEE